MKPKVLAISYLLAVLLGQTPKPANDNGLRLTRPRLSAMRRACQAMAAVVSCRRHLRQDSPDRTDRHMPT